MHTLGLLQLNEPSLQKTTSMAEGGAGDRIRCSVCTALGPKQADCEWFWDADTLKACCISVVVGEGTGKIIA